MTEMIKTDTVKKGEIAKRYSKLTADRSAYLEDAYRASELTIQFLLPRNTQDKQRGQTVLKKQHQSIGAMGTNNIANKLLLTLFPPNQPFFKFGIDDFTALELTDDDKARSAIEQGFSAVERATTDYVERSGIRPPFEEALKHLIVCGNILIHRMDDGGLEIFHMDQYVVFRDPDGKVREIVIEELHIFDSLPVEIQDMLLAAQEVPDTAQDNDEIISMYTRIKKESGKDTWKVTQEIKGMEVPVDGVNTFKHKDNPWFALRFHAIKGSSWGRGYVHNFMGDLDTLEQLQKSFNHAAKIMAFVLFMLRPGSTVRPKDIIEKINGGFISANEGDVTILQANKGGDLQVVLEAIDRIIRRMVKAFLMDESITRDAERVTAEEIRILANKLEESLGGFYSILTQDFQLPYLTLTLADMRERGEIPDLPEDIVKPIIITGLDALGRNSEAERMGIFMNDLQAALGPEVVSSIVNPLDIAKRIGSARGIDTKGLLKEADVLAQEKKDAQQQVLREKSMGPAISAGAKVAATEEGQKILPQVAEQIANTVQQQQQ